MTLASTANKHPLKPGKIYPLQISRLPNTAPLGWQLGRETTLQAQPISPQIMNNKKVTNRSVRLIGTSEGADFEIDLSYFPEPEPIFAYVDDLESRVLPLSGLVIVGKIEIENQPSFMWLEGTRNCIILKTYKQPGDVESVQKFVSLRSLSVGEFCLEIYHVQPDGIVELLHQNDFVFK